MEGNNSIISQQTEGQKKVPIQPQIQRECAGPQLAGLGQKKEKEKQQQPQSQSLSQQLESNLGEQVSKQNDSINESLDQSEEEMNQFFQALSSIKPVKIVKNNEELPEGENQEQDIIFESEIYSKVIGLANHGYELLIQKENLTEAIVELRRAENVISTYLFSEGSVQQSLVLFTLSNLAIAYYRIGFLEESLVCLENCLVSLKNQTEFTTLPSSSESPKEKNNSQFLCQTTYFSQLPGRLASKRLRCNFHMQCCIILSEMRRHEDALIHSRLAARLAFKIIIDTMVMALGVFICLFFDENENQGLSCDEEDPQNINEELMSNENSQALRRSKKTYEESANEDLAITSNKNLQESAEEDVNQKQFEIEKQKEAIDLEDQLQLQAQQLKQQQQQQTTRVESFGAFMQIWQKLQQTELKPLFENFNNAESRNYLLELIPILLELNTKISGSANHYDMAISPYKGEIILNTLSKKALNLNSQNIDLSKEVFKKPVIESIFNGVATDSPLFNLSILALLQLQPLSIEEFAKKPTLQDELSPEFILKKISYFAITLYCSSTETRFLEDQHMLSYLSPYQLLDSEILLGKSLEVVFTFLKPEMVFVSQIIAIYQRFHKQNLQSIPEDLELNEKYLVLKPLNGRHQKFRNLYPIIRLPLVRGRIFYFLFLIFFIKIQKMIKNKMKKNQMKNKQQESNLNFKIKRQFNKMSQLAMNKDLFQLNLLLIKSKYKQNIIKRNNLPKHNPNFKQIKPRKMKYQNFDLLHHLKKILKCLQQNKNKDTKHNNNNNSPNKQSLCQKNSLIQM